MKLPIDDILVSKNQPREYYRDLGELVDAIDRGGKRAIKIWDEVILLASSILGIGLQTPLLVYEDNSSKFYLIDGHRRKLAIEFLIMRGEWIGDVKCNLSRKPKDDIEDLLIQVSINNHQIGLNDFELARSWQKIYTHLKENGGEVNYISSNGKPTYTILDPHGDDKDIWEVIERKMGISRSRRYQIMALLKLPPNIQKMAEKKGLPESRVRYITKVKDESVQEAIINEIVDKNLSNHKIKTRVQELTEVQEDKTPNPSNISSVIRSILNLEKRVHASKLERDMSLKDPRTVKLYIELIPQLEESIKSLQYIKTQLYYLEE